MANGVLVVKIGGGEGIDPEPVLQDIARRVSNGERIVLVHGGSHETNELSEALGHPPTFMESPSGHVSRRTDRRTLEIFMMAYCGRINKSIVERLRSLGVDAVGLSGIDGGLWTGKRRTAIRAMEEGRTVIVRDDLSGSVDGVDASLLQLLLDNGRTPVLTPPAVTEDGVAINVDADRAAAKTAGDLRAEALALLSNVPGVLRDFEVGESTLIRSVADAGIEAVRDAAKGRMKNKVLAAEEALNEGVGRVVIASARGESPLDAALRGESGTVFEAEAAR